MTGVGTRVRPPAVAGLFYPGDARELSGTVDSLLAAATPAGDADAAPEVASARAQAPVALIAPHAGYRYSGAIAASAYVRLSAVADSIRRVVLLGPAHRVPVDGLGTSSADRWRTPLGDVAVDAELRARAAAHRGVAPADRAHAPEHSLEVHLPFLQRVLDEGWTLCPLIVGRADPGLVADVLDDLWDARDVLVVASTDLSHYHDQTTAQRLDRDTVARIVARSPGLEPTDACGARPVAGLLELARRRDLEVHALDVRTSGDTQGDLARVVGYAALELTERATVGA